jgi:hypothetical protein
MEGILICRQEKMSTCNESFGRVGFEERIQSLSLDSDEFN